MSAHVRPRASSTPRRWLRDRDEPQVAMTSPMPARPGEGQRVRAGGDPDPGHLGQATGHQPRLAVVAEAELLRRARRDRDDVLEGPAQLDAEHVAVHVEPEPTAAEPLLDPRGERHVLRRDDRRRRQPAGDLQREVGARQRGDAPRIDGAGLGDDLGHPQVGPGLDALHDRQHGGRGREVRRGSIERLPDVGRRDGDDDEVDRLGDRRRIVRGADRVRQVDARQARLVAPGVADACRRLRGVADERDRLPLGEDGGERRAPGTRAEDGHPRRRTGEPRGRARPLGAAHQLRRLRATRRFAGRFSRICSRNTSRIGVPSKL